MDTDLLRNTAALGGIISVIIAIARFALDNDKKGQEEFQRYEERQKNISKLINQSDKLMNDYKNLAYQAQTYVMDSELESKRNEIEEKWREIEIETSSKRVIDNLIEADMRMSPYENWYGIFYHGYQLQEDGTYEVYLYKPHKTTGKTTINMNLGGPIMEINY